MSDTDTNESEVHAHLDPLPQHEPEPAEPMTATDRLRAFEDEHFGKGAVRINGRIERGSGSPYQNADPKIRKTHAALEQLIAAEQKLADATGAMHQAEADFAAAEKAVDATSDE